MSYLFSVKQNYYRSEIDFFNWSLGGTQCCRIMSVDQWSTCKFIVQLLGVLPGCRRKRPYNIVGSNHSLCNQFFLIIWNGLPCYNLFGSSMIHILSFIQLNSSCWYFHVCTVPIIQSFCISDTSPTLQE